MISVTVDGDQPSIEVDGQRAFYVAKVTLTAIVTGTRCLLPRLAMRTSLIFTTPRRFQPKFTLYDDIIECDNGYAPLIGVLHEAHTSWPSVDVTAYR